MASATWRNQNWLVPFTEAKVTYLELDSTNTSKDAKLPYLVQQASRAIESACRRKFMPFVDTRYYDHPDDVRLLRLDEDLLSVTTLTTENDTSTLTASDYILRPSNRTPYHAIELLIDQGEVFGISTSPQEANKVVGLWGYHQDTYDSGADINEGAEFGASDTTLTVTDGTRFEIGMHLLIDSEQLFVGAISSNNLTVARGINGTTAAAHDDGSSIYVYRPPEDIVQAACIMVARFDKRAASAGSDLAGTPESGFRLVGKLPKDVQELIAPYVKVRIEAL